MIVTNQIPMAYDLDRGDILRLRGDAPWDERFLEDLANLMQSATSDSVLAMKSRFAPETGFNHEEQIERVTAFLSDLIEVSRSNTRFTR